jgi:hypothetical protein
VVTQASSTPQERQKQQQAQLGGCSGLQLAGAAAGCFQSQGQTSPANAVRMSHTFVGCERI